MKTNMDARKHYFFDMDGTLTENKGVCSPEIKSALLDLQKKHDIIIVSGADHAQIRKQLPFLPQKNIYVLAQSGNFATKGWKKIWKKRLNTVHKAVISQHIRILKSIAPVEPHDPNDIVQDRGGQVSYSVTGHNADEETKKNFDPTGSVRTDMLKQFPFITSTCQVRIGGTTCLDYTAIGWGKDGNVAELIGKEGWSVEDCMYVGDQLYAGGNDHDVINVLGATRCYSVVKPSDTLLFIKKIIHHV